MTVPGMTAPALEPVHGAEAAHWGGWTWREPMHGEHFRCCSYCGSIHPDDLAAEPEWRAKWADRKYGWPHKFYVDIANRQPDMLFVVAGIRQATKGPYAPGGERHRPPEPGYIAWGDLTDEQRAMAERDGWGARRDSPATDYVQFGTRPDHFGKFYTAHLADPAVSAETKTVIERRSGLAFRFDSGQVHWQAV